MIETEISHPMLILLIGVIIVLAILIKSLLRRLIIPPLVGFIALGFLLNLANARFGFLSAGAREIFKLLAEIGIITLLFRIGLESEIFGLLQQLQRASFVWVVGVVVSAALGYLAAWLMGLALLPALFVAIALTATSVGVSVGIWQDLGALDTPTGELLLDVAELDDISGIIFMALLFALAPILETVQSVDLLSVVAETVSLLLIKLALFGIFCFAFAVLLERHITKFFRKIATPSSLMLVVAGIGFVMASLAGLLGFSLAIGAFFAGLVFSGDPQSVKIDASFDSLYELFSPFFFVGLGLYMDPHSLVTSVELGLVLLGAAVFGKLLGHGTPTLLSMGWSGAVLVGVSTVPRAEIAMIIMEQGLVLGNWAVPPSVYSAMVLVSAATCVIGPFAVRGLLNRWPHMAEGKVT